MKRRKPLVAKTPLARSTAPMRRTPLPRSAPKRRRHAPTPIPPFIDKQLRLRSHGLCEAMLDGCTVEATDRHHRKLRSHGGEHTLDNLLHLCHHCHIVGIHHHTGWAYANGWLVRSSDDPGSVAISRGQRQS